MKKQLQKFMAALALLLFMVPAMVTWGQTTVTQTSFSAISGNVNNDTHVSYSAHKGAGTSNPAVNSNAIRLYQNTANQTGGYVVIGVSDGYEITSATIRSTMATTTGYKLTDTDPGDNTPAKSSFNVSDHSLSANTDYTVNGISTQYITFACFGTTNSARLYLSKISITYQSTSTQPTTYTVTLADDNTSLSGSSVTLPSRDAVGDYTFAGWSETNVPTETTTAPTSIIPAGNYTPTNDITLYPVYTRTEGDGDLTTSSTLANISNENNWTISTGTDVTCYTSFNLNDHITVSTTGSPNCGSFWGTDWRLYQNKQGNVIISTSYGTLKSVKFTYTNSNSGTLNYNSSAITSGTTVNVSGTSVEFTVGNSGAATNGQVRITDIDVTYSNSTIYYWSSPVPSTNPSITASDVNIAYDATIGSIEYSINNEPSPTGTLTASTSDNWLTLGTVTSSAVPFTCTENDLSVPRTATVTLTYTYNTNETITKDVTITQAGNPNGPGTQNNPYTVAQARAAIDAGTGTQGVYATGIVSQIVTEYSTQHSNITFDMVD